MSNDPHDDTSRFEEQISSLLSGFRPKPGLSFYQRISADPWNKKRSSGSLYSNRAKRLIRLASFTIITLLLLLLPIEFAPSLRSNARQLFRFFWVNDANTRSIEVAFTPTSTSESPLPESSFPLSIEEAVATAGYPLKTLTALPAGVTIEGAAYDQTRRAVLIRYAGAGKTVLFTQRENDHINEYASIGPGASVEFVMVRGLQGEYLSGGWVIQAKSTPQPALELQTLDLVWENQVGMGTLRWEENGYVYEIVLASSKNISRAEILKIAESMR